MKEILVKLKLLADVMGVSSVSAEVDKIILQQQVVSTEMILRLLGELLSVLSTMSRRMMHFRDRTGQILSKGFIIMFRKSETVEGEPTIVINDFGAGLKAENNPVIELELVYDDVDVRDEDFDTLLLMKN
jgi:hypothetical protein|nr:MAG TPA: hypothetical protein [Herelleviridae sp.]